MISPKNLFGAGEIRPGGGNAFVLSVNHADFPVGWDARSGSTAAANFGNAFVTAGVYLGMIVSSAVMPKAETMIINPGHPEFTDIEMTIIRLFESDSRLRG
ncbi:MAG: RES family NAD+ phosphorylase [Burkholderiales bacterium]